MQNLSKHLLISEFDKEEKKKRTKEQKNKISEKVVEQKKKRTKFQKKS